jgi:hypothetical protein
LQKRLNTNKKEIKKSRWLILLLFIILLLLLLFLFLKKEEPVTAPPTATHQAITKIDTLKKTEDTIATPVIKETLATVIKQIKKKKVQEPVEVKKDTADTTAQQDTLINKIIEMDVCQDDTIPLWVYPEPSGGLHRKAVKIKFIANKKSEIWWKTKMQTEWTAFTGDPVFLDSTQTINFYGIDSCGKKMDIRAEYYEFERISSSEKCLNGMEYVNVGGVEFCIDRYEWPNQKGTRPIAYISLYGAMDSCYSVEKRLCTADEWKIACMGPYSWKYPYGQEYERYACSTHDTSVQNAGSKPECRSFFGIYDMSGNLAEWTSTKSAENGNFHYVNGGFWESGAQGSCGSKRYSYYPQNRHNPVGFRCCKDVVAVDKKKVPGK